MYDLVCDGIYRWDTNINNMDIKLQDLVIGIKETAEREKKYQEVADRAEKKRREAHLQHINFKWLLNSKTYII